MKMLTGLVLVLMSMLGMSAANAAVVAGDLAPITAEITADIAIILPYAFGILAIVLAAIIGFKLVKKFTSAAT